MRITSRCEEQQLAITIADTGHGITEEQLKCIFRFGFTTKTNGNGFGLHSAAIAMNEMGGAIRVHSDGLGQGAGEIVVLPGDGDGTFGARQSIAVGATPQNVDIADLNADGVAHYNKTKSKNVQVIGWDKAKQNGTFAENFGDMTVHEVATDPAANLVYVSHYALGMRVLRYDNSGLEEVGAFVEAGGSNYWGVEVHKMNGKTYILGSDRDRGLRIFTFGG